MSGDKLTMIAGVCVFTAALCKVFENTGKEYSVLVKTAAAAAVMTAVITALAPAAELVERLYLRTGADGTYLDIMLKALGICYLTSLAAEICRDSGEGALAVQAEAAGKTALLLISLPLFEKAAELALGLINS
ncbi:MAG: stage III sporulation AC/AD family protein [Ruminococcus sp.]|nr:stage III sporulation AC/AD family protein [Ruminococcus sp.]